MTRCFHCGFTHANADLFDIGEACDGTWVLLCHDCDDADI